MFMRDVRIFFFTLFSGFRTLVRQALYIWKNFGCDDVTPGSTERSVVFASEANRSKI